MIYYLVDRNWNERVEEEFFWRVSQPLRDGGGFGHGGLGHLGQGLLVGDPLVVDEVVLFDLLLQVPLHFLQPVLAVQQSGRSTLDAGRQQALGVL